MLSEKPTKKNGFWRRLLVTSLILILAGAIISVTAVVIKLNESSVDSNHTNYSLPEESVDENSEEYTLFVDFSSTSLNATNIAMVEKKWGGDNGGVLRENIEIKKDVLILRCNGNDYNGTLKGINRDGTRREDGKRTGAAIATTSYYASGRYEASIKIAPELGVVSAMWTFFYKEIYPGMPNFTDKVSPYYYPINHEIDIELPGRPGPPIQNISFEYALMNTYVGEAADEHITTYVKLTSKLNDGEYHTFRFDWHTGDQDLGEERRVEYFIDNELMQINTQHVPQIAGRLWIGCWFPDLWAGDPNFSTTQVEVKWVRIKTFNESGDIYMNESFPNDGFT